jgi:hypothetical protein
LRLPDKLPDTTSPEVIEVMLLTVELLGVLAFDHGFASPPVDDCVLDLNDAMFGAFGECFRVMTLGVLKSFVFGLSRGNYAE